MKLNIDCVREILLWAEKQTTIDTSAIYVDLESVARNVEAEIYCGNAVVPKANKNQIELLGKFNNSTILYHIKYCEEAGLLYVDCPDGDRYIVSDLTPAGHNFINNIRTPSNFQAVKNISAQVGLFSLEAFTQIASKLATEKIAEFFK